MLARTPGYRKKRKSNPTRKAPPVAAYDVMILSIRIRVGDDKSYLIAITWLQLRSEPAITLLVGP